MRNEICLSNYTTVSNKHIYLEHLVSERTLGQLGHMGHTLNIDERCDTIESPFKSLPQMRE